jgi:hypothetical protein
MSYNIKSKRIRIKNKRVNEFKGNRQCFRQIKTISGLKFPINYLVVFVSRTISLTSSNDQKLGLITQLTQFRVIVCKIVEFLEKIPKTAIYST